MYEDSYSHELLFRDRNSELEKSLEIKRQMRIHTAEKKQSRILSSLFAVIINIMKSQELADH